MAGLSVENPEQAATGKYEDSVEFTSSIQEAILWRGGGGYESAEEIKAVPQEQEGEAAA
jgi:hypothetical protein